MFRLQSIIEQKMPLILQMRNLVCARRQHGLVNQYPCLFTFAVFAGPILCLLCYGIYRVSRYIALLESPAETFLLLVIVTWVGIGLKIQLRLHGDVQWNKFVRLMPVKPIHVLTVYVWGAIPVCLLGLVFLCSGLAGMGVRIWSLESHPVWFGLVLVFAWGMSLQVALGVALSLSRFVARLLLITLLLWWGYLVVGIFGHLESLETFLFRIDRLLLHDPVTILCGLRSILRLLRAPEEVFSWKWLAAAFHVGLLTGFLMMLSWIGSKRLPVPVISTTPRYIIISKVLRRTISRLFRGHCHAQFTIESVRMLRSGYAKLLVYMFLCIAIGVFLRVSFPGDNYSLLALALFVMLSISERADFVKTRNADYLYYQYGVTTREYLYGFTVAVGTLISGMCILQLPISWNSSLKHTVASTIACIALAYSSVIMCVVFDACYRYTKLLQGMLTFAVFMIALTEAWVFIPPLVVVSFNVIYVPCIAYGFLLLTLSQVNLVFVAVIGVFTLLYSVKNTPPGFVKKYFWRIEE